MRYCSSKTGSRHQSKKKHDFEALFKRNFKRIITSAKTEKSADKSQSQPWCSHSNTIYDAQLQKTIVTTVLRMQPRHQATSTQPSQCTLQHDVANPHVSTHMATEHHEVPFIAGCSHFTRKNARFRAPASSPTQAPCNIHAAITMHFAAWRG